MTFDSTNDSFDDDLIFDDPLPDSPFGLAQEWFDFAVNHADKRHWNSFQLSTVTPEGQPSARTLLMKDFDVPTGELTFYTNYESRKAHDIAANPKVSLIFHWDSIERQIRIEGIATKASDAISDAYFTTRDRESQIGAWASKQSEPLAGWDDLLGEILHFGMKFPADQSVPRPPHWGGYIVRPTAFEFWHGRTGRVHERVGYTRSTASGPWNATWLNP